MPDRYILPHNAHGRPGLVHRTHIMLSTHALYVIANRLHTWRNRVFLVPSTRGASGTVVYHGLPREVFFPPKHNGHHDPIFSTIQSDRWIPLFFYVVGSVGCGSTPREKSGMQGRNRQIYQKKHDTAIRGGLTCSWADARAASMRPVFSGFPAIALALLLLRLRQYPYMMRKTITLRFVRTDFRFEQKSYLQRRGYLGYVDPTFF